MGEIPIATAWGDRVDAFPFDPNHASDIDGDLIPDELDGDIDGNGEKEDRKGPDAFEPNNLIQDASFIALGTSTSQHKSRLYRYQGC